MSKKDKKKKNQSKPQWDLFEFFEMFVICTACIALVFSLFIRITMVDGDSMKETLHNGEYLIIRDIMYTPERGDIVVVNDVSKDHYGSIYAAPLVKRIIAVGGDRIRIDSGVVYLNGEELREDYIKETMYPNDMKEITLGEHEVFIMGDNRNHSGDSRVFGPVDERCIIGKPFLRVYPFNTFSLINN